MWAETRTVPIMDDHGDLTSSLSITFDVTSLIRRQQQIEEKNRDLEDFSYMISHDLKAPIFTIKGMMQILQEDLQITTESSTWEIIQHINAATDRLEQLVQSVVDYSRVGIGESAEEVVNINSLLQDICNEITPQLSAVEGSISVTPAMPEVLGDRLKLYQIFSNLIGNAIKYRSPERKLEISITATYISPRYVQFLVKDNGLGIPSNRLQDIFRPFQRAHSKDIEGSGIGLACVKKLVSCLRGDVSVQSEVGVGSTFKVVLPLVEDSFFEAPDDNKLIQKKDEQ
jgi:signal transduction histidine kinase